MGHKTGVAKNHIAASFSVCFYFDPHYRHELWVMTERVLSHFTTRDALRQSAQL